MCKTKFLQIWSFSIILTSLHPLNLSFPLLFYITSTVEVSYHIDSLHRYL